MGSTDLFGPNKKDRRVCLVLLSLADEPEGTWQEGKSLGTKRNSAFACLMVVGMMVAAVMLVVVLFAVFWARSSLKVFPKWVLQCWYLAI